MPVSPHGWKSIKELLASKNQTELLHLIHDLYQLNPDNKKFIQTRFADQNDKQSLLESYRKIIIQEFFPDKGLEKLRIPVAKKAISSYETASGDISGTIDLMMTYIEQIMRFLKEYGDIDEKYLDSMGSVFENLKKKAVASPASIEHAHIHDRLNSLKNSTTHFGYGVHGEIEYYISQINSINSKGKPKI